MRFTLVSGLALSMLATTTLALAEDPATSVSTSTTAVPGGASTTVSATTPAAPVSTTTTTQAAIDAPTTQPMAMTPSPTEYRGESKTTWVNRPLLGTGLVLFGGTYTASAIVAAESGNSHDRPNLYYPVAGPWIDLAQRGVGAGDKVLLALDGVGQGVGALAVVTSFFLPESTSRSWFFVGSDKLQVSPTSIGRGGYGLGAVGKF